MIASEDARPHTEGDIPLDGATLEHLEWSRLVAAVLDRSRSPANKRRGRLRFARDTAEARTMLGETREAMMLMASGDGLPLDDLRDIDAHLTRVERHGTLDAPAFADVRITLEHAGSLRRFLGSRRTQAALLARAATFSPELDDLGVHLAHAIERDGTLKDEASDDLRRIRSEIAALRERIVGRLQDVIDKHRDLLSDGYYTLRDGRYVVPVRRDAHDRLHGIVHGESSSGSSIFVEPQAVVGHGNRLKMAEAEREREELRILTELSARLREDLPSMRTAMEGIEQLDLRNAAARLGLDTRGVVPDLLDEPRAKLEDARHPLLLLSGTQVVGNPIEVRSGQGLVISGPNAGGKTVVLKTLGLCALMVRCGLPLPVAEGSSLGIFDAVLCDMGDGQSTSANLSTFSAHVRNLAALLERTSPRALVLLDEVATGTDPAEGAALACALVDAFCARGAALVVTTHYEPLKAMSLNDRRLRSASVGFDAESMEPTFRLLLDVPGASSALAVARRFGLPREVVDEAERRVPEQARDFERLVRKLSEAASALEQERTLAARERSALAIERSAIEERAARLREQSKHKLTTEADKLMTELRQARHELDELRTTLRKSDELKAHELSAAQRKLAEVATHVAPGSALQAAVAQIPSAPGAAASAGPADLRVGARVYVPRLRSEAVIVELNTKGKAMVAVGAMKLWIAKSEAQSLAASTNQEEVTGTTMLAAEQRTAERSADNTVDVRGLRADDALAMVDSFIDRLYGGAGRVGYVLHGHGTGALRSAIREHFKHAPAYVESTRPGLPEEGGDAVTAFFLA